MPFATFVVIITKLRQLSPWRNTLDGVLAPNAVKAYFRHMQSSTVKQAFEKTGIPVRTLLNRIKAGTVQADKIGDGRTSAYLIPTEEVDRLVAEVEAAR